MKMEIGIGSIYIHIYICYVPSVGWQKIHTSQAKRYINDKITLVVLCTTRGNGLVRE